MRWKGALEFHRWFTLKRDHWSTIVPPLPPLYTTPRKTFHSTSRQPGPAMMLEDIMVIDRKKRCQASPLPTAYFLPRGDFYCSPALPVLFIFLSHFLFPFLGHKPGLQLVGLTHPGGPALIISLQRPWLPLGEGFRVCSLEDTQLVRGFSECRGPETSPAWEVWLACVSLLY